MRYFSSILAILGAQLTISPGFTQARGEKDYASPIPHRHRRSSRLARHKGVHLDNIEDIPTGVSHAVDVLYGNNEAGAYLTGSGCTSVAATIVIPTFTAPSSDTTDYGITASIGLDGITSTSLLQAGLDFYAEDDELVVDAWYEWYPDYSYDFSGFVASVGDAIRITITATSTTSGTVLVENLTKGASATHNFSDVSEALQEVNAEWIVDESFDSSASSESTVFFTGITFEDASATCGNPLDATIIDTSIATVTTTRDSVVVKFT